MLTMYEMFSILWLLLLLALVPYGVNLGPGALVATAVHQTFVQLVTRLGYLVETLLLLIHVECSQRLYLVQELVDEVVLDKLLVWVHTHWD